MRGRNDELHMPLPLMPADRIRGGLRFESEEVAGLRNAYGSIRMRYYFAQDRLGLFETPTPAYALVDLGVGGEVTFASRKLLVDLVVDNALDRAYFDHLSRYKEFALDPGRNIELKVSVPFEAIP